MWKVQLVKKNKNGIIQQMLYTYIHGTVFCHLSETHPADVQYICSSGRASQAADTKVPQVYLFKRQVVCAIRLFELNYL